LDEIAVSAFSAGDEHDAGVVHEAVTFPLEGVDTKNIRYDGSGGWTAIQL
jgi:hypothetical protein